MKMAMHINCARDQAVRIRGLNDIRTQRKGREVGNFPESCKFHVGTMEFR